METPAVAGSLPIHARNALAHLLIAALRDARERATLAAAIEIARRPAGAPLPAEPQVSPARLRACHALIAAGLLQRVGRSAAALPHGAPAPAQSGAGSDPRSALERIDPPWVLLALSRLERYGAVLPRTRSGDGVAMALRQARELFALELDFEVHEILEAPWQSATGPDRTALQGLVQAAVAWAHWQAGNRAGALSLARVAAAKLLADGRASWHGLAVAEVGQAAAAWADWIERGGTGEPPPRPFVGEARSGAR